MKRLTVVLVALAVAECAGCRPGYNAAPPEVLRPQKVLNFETLYQQNCAGCHGTQGKNGAAVALASDVYLAITDDATIRRITAQGVPGTPMPAFAQSQGGMLTDEQVDALVNGIRARAGKHLDLTPPSYVALAHGDPKRGTDVYNTYCAACHGAEGRGGSRAESIVDASYLALVSDRYLRTIVIAGRPELGAPDWRDNVPGKPMSEQDVSDVVAWLSAKRPANGGTQ
jgi:cytochrome c oxidase cbb3-type subunit 3